ncbi:hypothetical protein [Paraburkholderia sp.]|uniref:hypothetical protein n=1 Tax=Paraburkholderia sp. TaxID=1926495 RepID=UPI00239A39B2|nr:hypothetical protein [Paraburkholderia sp.]MDE1180791.1 hypothetical protein [Paraburkholderia sp.]
MAFSAFVASSTRTGKIVMLCALSSACAALLFSAHHSTRTASSDTAADAVDAPSAPLSRDADAARAAHPVSSVATAGSAPASVAASASTAQPTAPTAPTVKSIDVRSSFSEAVQRLGLDAQTTAMLTHAFSGEIDFRHDLRPGSQVSLVIDPAGPASAGSTGEAVAPLAARRHHRFDVARSVSVPQSAGQSVLLHA